MEYVISVYILVAIIVLTAICSTFWAFICEDDLRSPMMWYFGAMTVFCFSALVIGIKAMVFG